MARVRWVIMYFVERPGRENKRCGHAQSVCLGFEVPKIRSRIVSVFTRQASVIDGDMDDSRRSRTEDRARERERRK